MKVDRRDLDGIRTYEWAMGKPGSHIRCNFTCGVIYGVKLSLLEVAMT